MWAPERRSLRLGKADRHAIDMKIQTWPEKGRNLTYQPFIVRLSDVAT